MALASTPTKSDYVSLSERNIFEFFIVESSHASKTKALEYSTCLKRIQEHYKLPEDDADFLAFFKATWTHYQRLRKVKLSHDKILDKASDEARPFLRGVLGVSPDIPKKRRRSFASLGERMQKERTEGILQNILEFTERECPELTVTQLLGYLIHRVNIQSNKKTAQIGFDIFNSNSNSSITLNTFDVNEAIALMHSLTLSKHQMRKMRNVLSDKGIYFPTTNELLEGRKKLRPVITPILDNTGVEVPYVEVVKMTIQSIISLVPAEELKKDGEIEMIFKDGCDGAGQQVVWKSTSMINAKENVFQYGITPLKLQKRFVTGDTVTLWENHAPNSCRSLRPLYLIRNKETDEDLLYKVIPSTDKARAELSTEGVCVTIDDVAYNVQVTIHDTMKDLKFKKSVSGLGGADCILCKTRQEDWTNKDKIAAGFPINRSAEDTLTLYNELVDEDGHIATKSGDFETRQGLTQQPITTSDQTSITITHSYINGTSWFLKVSS